MADTKSGTESIQNVPGTHYCTRKKGSDQRLLIISKEQRSQPEGAPIGRGDKLSIKSSNNNDFK